MNAHTQLVFALGLASLCVLGAAVFVVWLVGAIVVDLYRHLTRGHTYIEKSELDPAYRTKQFHIPPNLRDAK